MAGQSISCVTRSKLVTQLKSVVCHAIFRVELPKQRLWRSWRFLRWVLVFVRPVFGLVDSIREVYGRGSLCFATNVRILLSIFIIFQKFIYFIIKYVAARYQIWWQILENSEDASHCFFSELRTPSTTGFTVISKWHDKPLISAPLRASTFAQAFSEWRPSIPMISVHGIPP